MPVQTMSGQAITSAVAIAAPAPPTVNAGSIRAGRPTSTDWMIVQIAYRSW
jgi:hypothetical protein